MNKIFLFSHRGALGDFVLTWPTLVTLRWKFADHQFVGLGRPDYLKLAAELGLVDAWHDCESREFLPFYAGEMLPKILEGVSSALLWMEEEPKLRVLLHQKCQGPFHIHPPFPESKEHVMDYHLQCLPYFSLPAVPEEDLYFPITTAKQGYALIHPGSGSIAKNYDPEFYAFLANELKSRRFPDTRILIGPAERNLKPLFEKRFPIVEPPDCLELALKLSEAGLFIGNDSGVSHLSAILGTKTLALFKSTDCQRWGVRGRDAQSLEASSEAQAMTRIQKALQG
ncbi:MAG TPA: glycosyltransferase family 9 protein [Fibrobacteria bacterium]|nr:glycosyltransferase family 9 protein [Fibrobacteria bacterium]